jgi:hypothetical protein
MAADKLEASGALQGQARRVLVAYLRHPGYTTAHLAAEEGLDRHMVARRASDLHRSGYLRAEKLPGCEINYWPQPRAIAWEKANTDEIRDPRLTGTEAR